MTISMTSRGNELGFINADATSWVSRQLADCTSSSVPISALIIGDTPRDTEDTTHARLLADVLEELPPILVHGPSRKVIDGAHRVRAAVLCGEDTIRARIYSGSLEDAFVVSVNLNAQHGLPLSRAERAAAGVRILKSHPQWSDRVIAQITGQSASAIGHLRDDSAALNAHPVARVGKDGRVRPVDGAPGRLRASELLAARPDASARAIAREAGVSAGTVLDVRRRLAAGEPPVSPRRRGGAGTDIGGARQVSEARWSQDMRFDTSVTLTNLVNDPSMRFSNSGRFLLRWMTMSRDGMAACQQIVDSVPDHCASVVAKLARSYAALWAQVADMLERRSGRVESSSG